jgi:hypothetical protein
MSNVKTGWFRVILALSVTAEAVAVFFGLKDLMPHGTLAGGVIPIVTAIVVAGAFFTLWDTLCCQVPAFRAPHRRIAGVALGVILMAITIAASSWFIAAAIGGEAALAVHEEAFVVAVQAELDKAAANARAEKAIYTKVIEIEAAWRGETKREARFGTQSGKQGDGPVTMLYAGAADSLLRLAQGLADKNNESESVQRSLLDLIKAMRQAPGQAEFIQKATEATALLVKLDGISGVADARNFGIVAVDTRPGDLKLQVDNLTEELRRAAKGVEDKRRKVEPVFYAPMRGTLAIIEYPSASPGAWIVGVAVDAIPFLVLILLVLITGEAHEREARVVPFKAAGDD